VVDDQLRASGEQVCKRFAAIGAALPRQLTPLGALLVAQAIEFLRLREVLLAGFDPRLVRNNGMIVVHHIVS
jgi:hypothetical protein